PKGMVRGLQRELEADRAKLAQRWEPAQMLGFWAPVLDAHRDRKDLAASALKDAQRVLDDPRAKGEAKGQALLVQGLALRNEERFAEALPVLKKAQAALAGSRGDAPQRCEAALREVSDPAASFARKAQELEAQGKRDEALAVLERGLKVVPDR